VIEEQGKLTDELKDKILSCTSKTVLEDLYLPFKPKRRTRAMIARERGLEPLALKILAQPSEDPLASAAAFVNAEGGVEDAAAALSGARDIVAEMVSENADVRGLVRRAFFEEGQVVSEVADPARPAAKFEQYYDFKEKVSAIPSHRFLAIGRAGGEGAGVRLTC
jgi:uncharacterized protein